MKCKGNGCNNEVEKGHCELCYLEWEAKKCGYILTGEIQDGKVYGVVLTREDLVK